MEDRTYLDARFDGLEKLMLTETRNLKEYVASVSANNKEYRHDCDEKVASIEQRLDEHKESPDAHGARIAERGNVNTLGWLGLVMAAGSLIVAMVAMTHK